MEKYFCLSIDLLLQMQTSFFKSQVNARRDLAKGSHIIIASTAFLFSVFFFVVVLLILT